ncbi:gluconate 2-dehydrogenase subunit 3 family protein [Helicobacter sp. 13S00477-4]|uniref:gluconate 2-dehydrogenase subunit 3 family protein n=1 Tax=Helicobacter sp. 13S00477-4 TaxID=1905759 RepID=UPI000BA7961F|nr:gluconate 2-dehydrogenase subunit 3 family protein [Helicobacter sp. 13S00477-4]PAF52677.1 hypothetical protein BKH44_00380 [Helicobacter sp. 13S00477-4]
MNTQDLILSRRRFLKTSALAAGAILGSESLTNSLEASQIPPSQLHNEHSIPMMNTQGSHQVRGRMFFTKDKDFEILSVAVQRIFPNDDLGPGAIELGVPYFIDNQLAGSYGNNVREYMQGPFKKGSPTQGYQTPMIRQEIFLQGILELDKESFKRFKKSFTDIPEKSQDIILKDFESNKVSMQKIQSSYFFSLLREMTLCGIYADPIYNGNDDKKGWKMKQFPGAQMSYLAFIEDKNFQKIPPMSLADMQKGE